MGFFCYAAHYHTSRGSWTSKTIDYICVSAAYISTLQYYES